MVVTVLMLVALITWRVTTHSPATRRPDHVAEADAEGAARALRDLVDAVVAHDPQAAAALAPSRNGAAGALLTAVVANAEALDVGSFALRYVGTVQAPEGGVRWSAAVEVTWRFEGYDDAVAQEEVTVGFVATNDAVRITGIGGLGRRTPLWLTGPLDVRRSPRSLVLSAGTAAVTDVVARRADRAVPQVRAVLPSWPGRLVVEVPSTDGGLAAALGAEPGTYQAIAAVTASVDGRLSAGAQLHVFVNPGVYMPLDRVGGQVVLTHEATHVATLAPLTAGVPLWLSEGFADYVALSTVDLPRATTAAQAIEQVRRDGVPSALPGSEEFAASGPHLGAAYEGAWLACTVLAAAGGQQALVRLYTEVADGGALAPTLEQIFGLTEAGLTTRWQTELETLAATS